MLPVKPRSDPVTRVAVTSLTKGGSCRGSLTAEAACVRMESATNTATPDTAIRMPPSKMKGLFYTPWPHLNRLRSDSISDIDFECNLKRRPMMRVSRVQAAENRENVINVASRLFRERGFDGIGLKDLMKGAGLTQGAFYKQFASKEDLAARASRRALESATLRWSAATAAKPKDPLG